MKEVPARRNFTHKYEELDELTAKSDQQHHVEGEEIELTEKQIR